MELTVREVAALLGRSERTIRAQIRRGDLPGIKRGGSWRVPRQKIPLTETQRQVLQDKADTIRQTVDAVLPSRLAPTSNPKLRSIADCEAFRRGSKLLRSLRDQETSLDDELLSRIRSDVESALLSLAEAAQQFDRDLKLRAVNHSRSLFAQTAGRLLIATDLEPPEPVYGWIVAIETDVMPAVAGFARWVEALESRRRQV